MTQNDTTSDYDRARARLEKKRKFRSDLVAYVVINAFLVGIWAFNGAGYFWPGWVLAGWGLGLILTGWDLFYRHDITDDDIQRELRNGK
ncbi:MAG TPA: 2TM domain-containing protein [Dermatophilaceae bacterium]|nr:2TM domain-containing protein [Dermatophilaceae bacterium]